jgi:hypothetical protein
MGGGFGMPSMQMFLQYMNKLGQQPGMVSGVGPNIGQPPGMRTGPY